MSLAVVPRTLLRSYSGPAAVAAVAMHSRGVSSASKDTQAPTGVLLVNMGGPADPRDTGPFLWRLFHDRDLIRLPMQRYTAPWIAKRRTPSVTKQYEQIGGSPIRRWTEEQAQGMVQRLDQLRPASAPHKAYVAFRYADPLTDEALDQMEADGVTRAVAFTQYPHFSCSTSGSSFNELWRRVRARGMANKIAWSLIDRWPTHPKFIAAVSKLVQQAVARVPEPERRKALVLFSAHSLPLSVVNRGDTYNQEVAATVQAVMDHLGHCNPYLLTWQSVVGPLPWLSPQTVDIVRQAGERGHSAVVVVPIAFTSDHIETLYEVDVEMAHVARDVGIKHFIRADALNGEPLFQDAMAELVAEHLDSGSLCSTRYPLNCPGCPQPDVCRDIVNPATGSYQRYVSPPSS